MAYPGVVDDFRSICEFRSVSHRPVFSLGLDFDTTQAGLTCRQIRTDIDAMVRCKVEAVQRFDYDLVEIFPDDYIEFEPLGLAMNDAPDVPVMPLTYLPMTRDMLNAFRLPDPRTDMRLPLHLAMLEGLKAAVGNTACVMGRIAAPFSAQALVYGIDTLLIAMLEDPALVHDNLCFFTEHQIMFGHAQLEAPMSCGWVTASPPPDSCAASGLRSSHRAPRVVCGVRTGRRDGGRGSHDRSRRAGHLPRL
jgi:uroporphyrinogen-III decarboxylase